MLERHPNVLDPEATTLLVVDVQERFRPVMQDFDAMLAGCVRLVRTFRLLERPILITEQYPKGLGSTVPELREALGEGAIPEKTAFSSMGCEGLPASLRETGAQDVLVCGIEAHVCVNQTVHDLLAQGYGVHVAVDAVASRDPRNAELALAKMQRSGALSTSSEMAAFELMVDARHAAFKQVQALFR